MIFGGMGRTRRSSSSGSGGAGWIIIVLALVLMILAPIMAQLIYLSISRKREYLADASSALYTRYPEGLASALEKIAASTDQLKSANKATAPMYIINPFRKRGRAASNLTSTHPPISERIRILRSMAGASFADYDTSYRNVQGTKKALIPAAVVTAAGTIALRAPKPEAAEKVEEVQRARETSNLMWNINKYNTITCACGTKLRLPPGFKLPQVRCPHCGRINPV